jgi:Phage protein Gp138 N-terminal domain
MAVPPSNFLTIAQRLGITEEELHNAIRQELCAAYFALPGIVQSFDSVHQTVTVRIALLEKMNKITADGSGSAAPVPTPTPIPVLPDVPILIPRGGGFSVTLPVKAGDECLVIFADMCMSGWWATGGSQIPPPYGTGGAYDKAAKQEVKRRHSLSDGFAILGPWSQPRVLTAYDTSGLNIRSDDGATEIIVRESEVVINSASIVINGTTTINGALFVGTRDFVTHVHSGVTTGTGDTGPPV